MYGFRASGCMSAHTHTPCPFAAALCITIIFFSVLIWPCSLSWWSLPHITLAFTLYFKTVLSSIQHHCLLTVFHNNFCPLLPSTHHLLCSQCTSRHKFILSFLPHITPLYLLFLSLHTLSCYHFLFTNTLYTLFPSTPHFPLPIVLQNTLLSALFLCILPVCFILL